MRNSFNLWCEKCEYCLLQEKLTLFPPETNLSGLCPSCDRALLNARYELNGSRFLSWTSKLKERQANLWRYHELLPINDSETVVSLGEGCTPLIQLHRFGSAIGLKNLGNDDRVVYFAADSGAFSDIVPVRLTAAWSVQ